MNGTSFAIASAADIRECYRCCTQSAITTIGVVNACARDGSMCAPSAVSAFVFQYRNLTNCDLVSFHLHMKTSKAVTTQTTRDVA